MKIIEALKKIKDLNRKAEDIKKKVSQYSAHLSHETPMYQNQTQQVSEWVQAYCDICKEILRLRTLIQKTNLDIEVAIEIGGKNVTKTIAEWIHRRRDLAVMEKKIYQSLTDRGLKDQMIPQSTGTPLEVKVVRCYNPEARDKMMDILSEEPSLIDGRLEIVNAVTDLADD
jgi:hypothetical protein